MTKRENNRESATLRGKTTQSKRRYRAPATVFEEGMTVQCGVCTGGTFKVHPDFGGTCPTPSS